MAYRPWAAIHRVRTPRLTPRVVWSLLSETFFEWYEDRAARLGAALAFYTVFALAPALILIIALAALLLGQEAAQSQIISQVEDLAGNAGAQAVQAAIESARSAGGSLLATGLGALTLLFGLWGVFGELQDALNTIWGVTTAPGRGMIGVIKKRFWSFTMVVGIGFLLLVSLAASAWLAALGKFFSRLLPLPAAMMETANGLLSFVVITFMFAVIYKLLPDVRIAWRNVWTGAAVTAVLFTIGKTLIGLYLGRSTVGSVYGAAGSLIVILLWVYYSAQIVFFGAEFTKVYSRRCGAETPERALTRDLDVSREIGDRPRQPDGLDGLGGVGLEAG
ncbi:MAG TPA: YihY/virulence factor BrkB family protein [Methylomirabilota bacterium]|jgi:membrane protein